MPPADTVTVQWPRVDRLQLAALLGVHQDTVSDYTKQGMPVLERGGAGVTSVYDAVACVGWWRERNSKLGRKDEAQIRRENSQAAINEQKLARERGELVSRDQVVDEGRQFVKAWQAKVRALPRRLVLLGLISREDEPKIREACLELLREIATWKTVADLKRAIEEANAA